MSSAFTGRSTGNQPTTVAGMTMHALDFLDALCLSSGDVFAFSLGGVVAQQMALKRPSIVHRMILVGTAPGSGDDIMHLEKPSLARHLGGPTLKGYAVLQRIFFAPPASSQAAGGASCGLADALTHAQQAVFRRTNEKTAVEHEADATEHLDSRKRLDTS